MNPNPNAHLHRVTWPRDDPLYNDPVYDVTEGLLRNLHDPLYNDPVYDVTEGLLRNISPDDDLTDDDKLIRGCGSWDSDREVGIAGHSDNSAQPTDEEDILSPSEKHGESVDVDSIKDKKNIGQEQGFLFPRIDKGKRVLSEVNSELDPSTKRIRTTVTSPEPHSIKSVPAPEPVIG